MFWKQLYCFDEHLWRNTSKKPPSIQYCSQLNTDDLSEEFDVEYSFEILSTTKKDNTSVSALVDEEENYHPGWRNFFGPFSVYP